MVWLGWVDQLSKVHKYESQSKGGTQMKLNICVKDDLNIIISVPRPIILHSGKNDN